MLTSFQIGGTERQVTKIAVGLDSSRFDLHLACLRNYGELLAEVEALSAPRPVFPIGKLYSFRTFVQAIRLIHYIRRNAIQVVHSYGLYSNLFTVPAAWLSGARVVIASIRDRGDIYSPLQRRLQKAVCRLADCVLVNAEAIRETLIEQGYPPDNIVVIRNGVTAQFAAAPRSICGIREEYGWPGDTPVVVLLSRLNPMKGIEYFLDASALVAAKLPRVRFLIVGDGAIKREMQSHAALRGLADRVVFSGFRTDVPALLPQADLSVLPSLSEGLSNTLLESMGAGVPVIATNVGGNSEVIENGVSGLLVASRDSGALAAAMVKVLENASLAAELGGAGRQRVAELFSMDRSIREVELLYEQLVDAPGNCLMKVAAQ